MHKLCQNHAASVKANFIFSQFDKDMRQIRHQWYQLVRTCLGGQPSFVDIPWLWLPRSLSSDWPVSCPCPAERSRLTVPIPTPLPMLPIGVAEECQRLAPVCASRTSMAAFPRQWCRLLRSLCGDKHGFIYPLIAHADLSSHGFEMIIPVVYLTFQQEDCAYRREHSFPEMCIYDWFETQCL